MFYVLQPENSRLLTEFTYSSLTNGCISHGHTDTETDADADADHASRIHGWPALCFIPAGFCMYRHTDICTNLEPLTDPRTCYFFNFCLVSRGEPYNGYKPGISLPEPLFLKNPV